MGSNGGKYWIYAEYLCKPFEDLVSYWDLHHCGPFAGKDDKVVDHNQWMCYGIKNRRHKTCRDEVDMSTTFVRVEKLILIFIKEMDLGVLTLMTMAVNIGFMLNISAALRVPKIGFMQ